MVMGQYARNMCLGFIILVFLNAIVCSESIKSGEVIKKIVCLDQKNQSYALYLPIDYSRKKKWPIIYAFDPGGSGKIPVERFQPAARKYGYIVVGSNNARNGPTSIFIEALKAMWTDTQQRFSIDGNRVYTAGFSGGARMAVAVPHVIGSPISGVIGCGAGLPSGFKTEHLFPAIYYGIIGLCDMNYQEMIQLDRMLEKSGAEYHVLITHSQHHWPASEHLTRAVEWMEIMAIKRELRTRDISLIQSLYLKGQKYALELETRGYPYLAARAYGSVVMLFNDLADVQAVKEKLESIKDSTDYNNILKAEQERRNRESDFIERFNWVLNNAEKQSLDQNRIKGVLKDLQVPLLLESKKNNKDIFESCWAERLLEELNYRIKRKSQFYYNEKIFDRSIFFTEILNGIFEDDPNTHYYLACLFSLTGQKKKALHNLKKAVRLGFSNLDLVKKDTDLNALRDDKEFKELLQKIKNESQHTQNEH